eukprot:365087-Chlamydomonas_euryale.AAC.19
MARAECRQRRASRRGGGKGGRSAVGSSMGHRGQAGMLGRVLRNASCAGISQHRRRRGLCQLALQCSSCIDQGTGARIQQVPSSHTPAFGKCPPPRTCIRQVTSSTHLHSASALLHAPAFGKACLHQSQWERQPG